MEQHDNKQPGAPGFGTNTNGLGILIVAIAAVCLALFCWKFWNNAQREADLYRYPSTNTEAHQ